MANQRGRLFERSDLYLQVVVAVDALLHSDDDSSPAQQTSECPSFRRRTDHGVAWTMLVRVGDSQPGISSKELSMLPLWRSISSLRDNRNNGWIYGRLFFADTLEHKRNGKRGWRCPARHRSRNLLQPQFSWTEDLGVTQRRVQHRPNCGETSA